MTTYQATANAKAQSGASSLPIITVQRAQSSRSETAESDFNIPLPPLPDIKNPAKLKEISSMKLTDSNFHK